MKRASIRALPMAMSIALASACVPAWARADEADTRADCVGSYCADDTIYQFGPSAAFAASLFEGPTSFRDVLRLGDFGLGATSPLEGEVIVLDGTAYQASPTGVLDILPPSTRTPFAVVKHFRADRRVDLPEIADLDELGHALDAALPSRNRFYAVRIEGQFDYMQLRSIPRQAPPYPELAEVVRGQNVFGTDFAGGDSLTVQFDQRQAKVDPDKLREVVMKAVGADPVIQYQKNLATGLETLRVTTVSEKGETRISRPLLAGRSASLVAADRRLIHRPHKAAGA